MKKVIYLNKINNQADQKAIYVDVNDGFIGIEGYEAGSNIELRSLTEVIKGHLAGDIFSSFLLVEGTYFTVVNEELNNVLNAYKEYIYNGDFLRTVFDAYKYDLIALFNNPTFYNYSELSDGLYHTRLVKRMLKLLDIKLVDGDTKDDAGRELVYANPFFGKKEFTLTDVSKAFETVITANASKIYLNNLLEVLQAPVDKKSKSIEIGCAPGGPRPPYYLAQVLKGTGIPVVEHSSAFFGDFLFPYDGLVTSETWANVEPLIQERLQELYAQGAIRYASFN